MLNLVIAIFTFIIWSSIAIYYFRTPLMHWFDNHFGKDPVLPEPEEEEHPMSQHEQAAAPEAPAPAAPPSGTTP